MGTLPIRQTAINDKLEKPSKEKKKLTVSIYSKLPITVLENEKNDSPSLIYIFRQKNIQWSVHSKKFPGRAHMLIILLHEIKRDKGFPG